ncbi:hypothetical protein KIPB_000630 [Kipferlia bialata]|uniref:Initiation factor eIF2 gamma C-terminal domain-containing protein n=1 Tax=Kipferlia bialata TaxID=797122 RepID=A0A9K3CNS4_9EUKA|nr:hypothetical protein KIPB_000630 [Kipferlia bialata]|eukprot:g630.t1
MVNVGAMSTGGDIEDLIKVGSMEIAKIRLRTPVCIQPNEKVAISRRIEQHWRLIGWGEVTTEGIAATDETAQ